MENVQYIEFSQVSITIAVIAGVLAFIVLTGNAIKAITQWREMARRPTQERVEKVEATSRDHEQRISSLERCCTDVQGKLQSDWEFQKDETEMNRLMLKSIKQLLKHSLDGNDTDGLKSMEKEVDDYLLKHMQ